MSLGKDRFFRSISLIFLIDRRLCTFSVVPVTTPKVRWQAMVVVMPLFPVMMLFVASGRVRERARSRGSA
jgi:hypothetical protein